MPYKVVLLDMLKFEANRQSLVEDEIGRKTLG